MQAKGEGFYTIGSSGHEGNAAVAAAFRPTDMAFLHYRDAAFLIERSKQVPGGTPARCNPINAPAWCRPEDIENPAYLTGNP